MSDPFAGYSEGLTSPADDHFAITPNDGVDLATVPRALYVNVAGTLVLHDKSGTAITYNVTAGQVLPLRVRRVLATGTTATVVGWY